MKKTLILAVLGCMTLSGATYAASRERNFNPERIPESFKKHLTPGEALGEMHVGNNTYYVIAPPETYSTRDGEAASVPTTPIIYKAPGESRNYIKDVEIAYASAAPLQGLYGMATPLKWDNNDVYFYNFISYAPATDTYVKATKNGDKIVLPMNQTVLDIDDEDESGKPITYSMSMGLLRPVFSKGDDGTIFVWYQYSDDYDSVDYTVNSDGSFRLKFQPAKYDYGEFAGLQNNPYLTIPPYALGYFYNDDLEWTGWTGYCELTQDFTPFNYPAVEVPAGLTWNTFSYKNSAGLGVIVYVAETADAFYIKGLSAYLPDAVFKADKLDNGKISVNPGQYIGMEYGLFYVITNTGMMGKWGNQTVVMPAPDDTPAIFVVTRDSNGKVLSISADPDSEYFLVFDDDPGYFYDMDSFKGVTINSQDSFAGTPSTPRDLEYAGYGSWMGANYIFFKLSPFSTTGDVIDINKLYYNVFVNGDPYEFEPGEGLDLMDKEVNMYSGLKSATYSVPYTFGNDVDLYEDAGGTFIVGLYADGIDTVGVQTAYTWGGTVTYSQMVTVDAATGQVTTGPADPSKIEAIDADKVAGVEYYDLQGRKIANPSQGIYVKKYILNDGTARTRKLLKGF